MFKKGISTALAMGGMTFENQVVSIVRIMQILHCCWYLSLCLIYLRIQHKLACFSLCFVFISCVLEFCCQMCARLESLWLFDGLVPLILSPEFHIV